MDKGLKTLLKTYWCSQGWRYLPPTPEEFQRAKEEGYMFDETSPLTHDETLARLRETVAQIDPKDVANAFLYSLSTRELQYRSALGSYYYALAIPEHCCTETEVEICYLCLWMGATDRNKLNFERHKWGGVRHAYLNYALFDLQQFLLLPKVSPTEADKRIFRSILDAVSELKSTQKAGAYRDLISKKKLFSTNKSEIGTLLDILGICGVLSSEAEPCYCDRFADSWHRAPKEHNNDFEYPVNWWRAADGINERRFNSVFGCSFSEL